MSNQKPYKTTDDLMQSIRDRIMFPFSQSTLSFNAVLNMVNEELILNAVPALRELHAEYFVYLKSTPIVSNIGTYPIPDRAQVIGLRNLFYSDMSGNFYEMVRIAEEDKAFFQYNSGTNQYVSKYYLQGNNVVLAPQISNSPNGDLCFDIFVRPNFLVRNERAAKIQAFQKPFTITDNTLLTINDTITITLGTQTSTPTVYTFKPVITSPSNVFEFQIGATGTITAQNLATQMTAANIEGFMASSALAVTTVQYDTLASNFTVVSDGMTVDNTNSYVVFDQLPTTYTDPETDITSDLYTVNSKVDFLQTNPGHSLYAYDVKLKQILPGNIGRFITTDLMTYLSNSNGGPQGKQFWPIYIGDYICLANESIIPQIPPEFHQQLAEMTASRILSAIGDQAGYQLSQNKLAQMSKQQAALISSRDEGSVPKVFNSSSLLRIGRRRRNV